MFTYFVWYTDNNDNHIILYRNVLYILSKNKVKLLLLVDNIFNILRISSILFYDEVVEFLLDDLTVYLTTILINMNYSRCIFTHQTFRNFI